VRVTAERRKPELRPIAKGGRQRSGSIDRTSLRAGDRVKGPAVISEDNATCWVERGWTGCVDSYGNIIICQ
jgi:N-methylhydantoinase A/oxoprolinase/acetone carboxylase beta subunit